MNDEFSTPSQFTVGLIKRPISFQDFQPM